LLPKLQQKKETEKQADGCKKSSTTVPQLKGKGEKLGTSMFQAGTART
jgi:hypothetical protein